MSIGSGTRWSSRPAFYLGTVGAAVGLGSIWRFPYLAGRYGGGVFVLAFLIAMILIATPLLMAEFLLGRWARRSPPQAAGVLAADIHASSAWNSIGWLGTLAAFLLSSYYTVIAGWVMAYAWKCAAGGLENLARPAIATQFRNFLADPLLVGGWHLCFLVLTAGISALGLSRGIEIASKIRAPALLCLLLVLTAYALLTGDVARGLTFAFAPDFSKLTGEVLLAAVGQAFYATGIGMAVMIAYGAYMPREVSLLRSATMVIGGLVLVSLLATSMIFPLVYGYGMNPAEGPTLVFEVLPTAFAEMPAGRIIGTLFFVLLILAALTPAIASLEPAVAWLEQRYGFKRPAAVAATASASWLLGLGSVLSFNLWSNWHPLGMIERFAHMTFFEVADFTSANILLPLGALLTSIFIGWRLPRDMLRGELSNTPGFTAAFCSALLRYICPCAILAVWIATLI